MTNRQIADNEVVYRRIPPGTTWFEPPDRITSANFKLRPGESGLSVYRAILVDLAGVLRKPDAIPGSGVAKAPTGAIRLLRNAANEPLELEVIPINDEIDIGHAEIRGRNGRITTGAARALKNMFVLMKRPCQVRH